MSLLFANEIHGAAEQCHEAGQRIEIVTSRQATGCKIDVAVLAKPIGRRERSE
jgi:hypothetical protein